MRRPAPFLFLVALAAVGLLRPAAAAAQAGPSVVVAEVDGSIDRTLAGFVTETIEEAERTGATVVLQLDSAGTLDVDAVALATRIFEARVPVVVWVGPVPAKAAGAALLLMYASSLSAVAPGVGVGPLEPLDLAGSRAEEAPARAEVEDLARSWAEARGRPADLTFPNEPVPAQDALDGNIAQVPAVSVPELLEEIDGSRVVTAAGEVTLRTKIAETESEEPVEVMFTELGPVDRVRHAAASPTWIYVLLVIGLASLAFELTQPGFGFAGFGGLALTALGVYGLTVVPVSWLGLVLLLGGIASLEADVLLRKLGVLTAAGLGAFAVGSVVAFRGVAPAIRVSPWLIGGTVVASFLYYGFALTVAVRSRERITSTQRGLVGLVGETRGELAPEGPVFVKGTLWRGRSADGPIPAGTRVRVRGLDGLVLRVEPEPDE